MSRVLKPKTAETTEAEVPRRSSEPLVSQSGSEDLRQESSQSSRAGQAKVLTKNQTENPTACGTQLEPKRTFEMFWVMVIHAQTRAHTRMRSRAHTQKFLLTAMKRFEEKLMTNERENDEGESKDTTNSG